MPFTTSLWAMPLAVFRWLSPCLVTSSNSSLSLGEYMKISQISLIWSHLSMFLPQKISRYTSWNNSTAQKTHLESSSCAWKVSYKASKISPKQDFYVCSQFVYLFTPLMSLSSACVVDIRSFIFWIQAPKVSCRNCQDILTFWQVAQWRVHSFSKSVMMPCIMNCGTQSTLESWQNDAQKMWHPLLSIIQHSHKKN